jgi:hypothetical protein
VRNTIIGRKGVVGSIYYHDNFLCLKIATAKSDLMVETITFYLKDLGFYLKDNTQSHSKSYSGKGNLSRYYSARLNKGTIKNG